MPLAGTMTTTPKQHGLRSALGELLRRPVPASRRGYLDFGWILVLLFFIQIVTGILLSFYYESSPEMAYDSIRSITRDITAGWLVRGIHHWAAQGMIAFGLLHLLRVFLSAAYKGAGPANWWVGLLLLLLVFAFAFTGSLLFWDQPAYWSAVVEIGHIEAVPVLGPGLASIVKGGEEVGASTLSRFYSIHTLILPWLTFYLLLLHLWLLRVARAQRPGGPG